MNIERPVTNISTNSNSKSLYQQTMSTIEQLYSLPGFEFYLFPEGVANLMKNNDGNPMIDPVAVLWGCFRLGAPLCHLMNAFKLKKLDVPDVTGLTTYNNTCKKCIYFFLLACKENLKMSEDSLFTITELYRDDTNGFVKVLGTVNNVLEELHKRDIFPPLKKLPFLDNKTKDDSPMDNRSRVIQELLVTERKYINDLQVLQEYENELKKNSGVAKDLIVSIFGNLGELLDFQRRFLIAMEATLALPFEEQRIGALFVSNEKEDAFSVYVPICGNYESAIELARKEADNLKGCMDPVVTLPSYLIKPVQRVCKYPLLLNEIIKLSSIETYPHLDELKLGLDVVKRVADRVNEMTRKNENGQLKENLRAWVSDWKYFDLDGAGELLLSDKFLMSTPDGNKEYHIFLFEKVLLCCKDQSKKVKKKRFSAKDDENQPSYALRGNIFMSSVIEVVNSSKPEDQLFNLRIYWKDVADMESFSLKCKNEEQVILWKQRLEKVILEEKNRKRRTNASHISTSASNLRFSVESNYSLNESEQSQDRDRYSHNSSRSQYSSQSPAESRQQTAERRVRAASLNQHDRSSSFSMRPMGRPQTFGNEGDIQPNLDTHRYSPLSPTPPQMALPTIPGQYPSRNSIDNTSSNRDVRSSSMFKKTPSLESLSRLSLNSDKSRRGSTASLLSPTMLTNSSSSSLLKVKVFYGSDIFLIALPGICSMQELLSKIERKIQLAGSNLPSGRRIKLRYKDEDGDFIQIFGDDDLLLAFEVCSHLGESNKGVMHLFVE